MINANQLLFLKQVYAAALSVGHRWPKAVACEAAFETGWGKDMPPHSNNVLGIKALGKYIGPKVSANGTEQNADGSMTGPQHDQWRVYPVMSECIGDQTHILHTQLDSTGKLAYRDALAATTIETYILNECRVWSTGTRKGSLVLQIYTDYGRLLV